MAQLLIGPLSGVAAQFLGWRASFLALALLALVVGGLLARRLGPAMLEGRRARRGFGLGQYLRLFRAPAGRRLMAAAAIDGAALFGGAFPFTGAYLIEHFALSPGEAGMVVAGFGLGAFIYTRLAKRAGGAARRTGADRRGRCRAGADARGGGGAGLVDRGGVAGADGHGLLHVPRRAAGPRDQALPESRATAVSAFAMALFLGQSVGALGFGAVLHAAGYGAVFAGRGGDAALATWVALTPARQDIR